MLQKIRQSLCHLFLRDGNNIRKHPLHKKDKFFPPSFKKNLGRNLESSRWSPSAKEQSHIFGNDIGNHDDLRLHTHTLLKRKIPSEKGLTLATKQIVIANQSPSPLPRKKYKNDGK